MPASRFSVVLGKIQGQVTRSALPPKLSGTQLSDWHHSIQRPKQYLTLKASSRLVALDLRGKIQGQMTENALAPKLSGVQLSKWSHLIHLTLS